MKWTVITGACGGLGQAFSDEYAKQGCALILHGRSIDRLKELKAELSTKYKVDIELMVYDFCEDKQIQDFCQSISSYPVERLICNAGFGLYGAFAQMNSKRLLDMHRVNMNALMLLNHAALQISSIKEIINVASTAAFQPGPWMSVYYATKAYVLSFSEALAIEVKSKGIKICTLCCGPMETNFAAHAHLHHTWMQKLVMVSPQKAVRCAMDGLEKGKCCVIPGTMNRLILFCSAVLPSSMRLTLMNWIQSSRK